MSGGMCVRQVRIASPNTRTRFSGRDAAIESPNGPAPTTATSSVVMASGAGGYEASRKGQESEQWGDRANDGQAAARLVDDRAAGALPREGSLDACEVAPLVPGLAARRRLRGAAHPLLPPGRRRRRRARGGAATVS